VVIYRIAVFMAVLASYTVSFLFVAACFVVTTFTLLLMKNMVLCVILFPFGMENSFHERKMGSIDRLAITLTLHPNRQEHE
jgi:hypothetical protein